MKKIKIITSTLIIILVLFFIGSFFDNYNYKNYKDYSIEEIQKLNLDEEQMNQVYSTIRLGRHKSDLYIFLPKYVKITGRIEPLATEQYGFYIIEVSTIFNKKIEDIKISEKSVTR